MSETEILDHCRQKKIGVSALETLPGGGVRLVCMSSEGAGLIRRSLKAKIMGGEITRERFRPIRPLW